MFLAQNVFFLLDMYLYVVCNTSMNWDNIAQIDGELGQLNNLLEKAQTELVSLLEERKRVDWAIHKLQQNITHLAALCQVEVDDPFKQLGMTDAIRWVVGASKAPLAASEVRDKLSEAGFDLSEYKNAMACVHTILKRLIQAGQVKAQTLQPGYTTFVWSGGLCPPPPALHRGPLSAVELGPKKK
jgi:hypothetical protein